MGTISKNFDYREFEKSDTAKRLGIINVINTSKIRDGIKALVLEVLQPLRDAWNKPLSINSGYRCQKLNEVVGGVATSQHCKGEAADIACAEPAKLAQLAYDLELPYDQMILYPTFVHFSHKLNGQQRKQVLYNKQYRGEKLNMNK